MDYSDARSQEGGTFSMVGKIGGAGRSRLTPLVLGSAIIALLFVVVLTLRVRPARMRVLHEATAPTRAPPRDVTGAAVPPPTSHPEPPVETYALDVCGVGQVRFDSDDIMAPGRYVESLSLDAQRRWRRALLKSGDNRARAVGLYLDVMDARREAFIEEQDEARKQAQNDARNEPPDEAPHEAQSEPQKAAQSDARNAPPDEQSRDALVQLAVGGADPAVYAIAVQACGTFSNAPTSVACQQITLNAWTRIDAGNAVPWLLLAGKARAGGDLATEEAAFARAAAAHGSTYYADSLYAYARAELPGDLTPLQQYFLALSLVGYQSAWALPQYRIVTQHCSADRMQTPIAKEQCDALAENFVTQGRTVLDLALGTRLGERVGWPVQRIRVLTEERKALQQMGPQDFDPWSCDTVHRGNDYLGLVAQLGEVAALRDALEHSGGSREEMAQKFDRFVDQILNDDARLNPAVRKANEAARREREAEQAAAARKQAEAESMGLSAPAPQ